jgi:ABC-type dipeptide/oligopeptide/nickel transport system permease component
VLAVPVLLGLSVIVFLIMALIPGDPGPAILGAYATPENVERLNRQLGPRPPCPLQYLTGSATCCRAISAAPIRSTGRSSTRCWSASARP